MSLLFVEQRRVQASTKLDGYQGDLPLNLSFLNILYKEHQTGLPRCAQNVRVESLTAHVWKAVTDVGREQVGKKPAFEGQ